MPDVKANGITLHYEERGAGDPLVLIVGLGSDGANWAPHLDRYEKHFRCGCTQGEGVTVVDLYVDTGNTVPVMPRSYELGSSVKWCSGDV